MFSGLVHHQSVRVVRMIPGYGEFFDFPRLGIEAADIAVLIARVPDNAIGADYQIMGAGIVGQVFADRFSGGRIQARHVMTGLADEPDMAGAGGKRIAGAAAIGYWPFLYIGGVQGIGGIGGASRPEQQGHKDRYFASIKSSLVTDRFVGRRQNIKRFRVNY